MNMEDKLKLVADHIENMTDEEFEKECGHLFIDKDSINSPWHPSKQNSFLSLLVLWERWKCSFMYRWNG